MSDEDVLGLVKDVSGAFEAYELRHFKIWRRTPDQGGERELLVTILDAGADAGRNRYMVEVKPVEDTDEVDPPYSLSNPDDTIDHALRGVHWNEFDRSIS